MHNLKLHAINCPLCGSNKYIYKYKANLNLDIVKCQDCSLIYANPQPAPEALAEFYKPGVLRWSTEDDFKKGRLFHFIFYTEQIRYYARKLPLQVKSVLDIGCGNGMFAEYIKNRLGVTTYGIEISPSDCKLAKKRVDQLFCASISEPGIYKKIDRQFDVAISSDVFEHIPNPHESMGNISQLVKPGGLLVVDTGDIGGFGAKLGGNKNPFTMDDGHIVFYSRKTLTRLLIEHGFDVLSVYDESQIYPAEKFSFGSLISKIKRFFISSPNITVIARKIDPSSAQMSQQNFV